MPFNNPKSFSDREWKRLGTKEARHAAVIAARAERRKDKKKLKEAKAAVEAAREALWAALRRAREPAPRVETEEDRKIAEFFQKEDAVPGKPVGQRNIEELVQREQEREKKKWCLICDGFECMKEHGEGKDEKGGS